MQSSENTCVPRLVAESILWPILRRNTDTMECEGQFEICVLLQLHPGAKEKENTNARFRRTFV